MKLQAFVIIVKDIEISRGFYEGLLGELIVADHGPNVVFASGLSIWEAEHASRVIFGPEEDKKAGTGLDNLELYFESEDIEFEFARLERAGVRIIQPVHEEPWGQRTFRVYDPDGHIVEVGEPTSAAIKRLFAKGYSPEKISERTSMPMEIVLQSIGYPRFC